MPGNWDFSGFSEGIDRGLVNRARNARMAKMDALAAEDRAYSRGRDTKSDERYVSEKLDKDAERKYQHEKDTDFETPDNFREINKKKNDSENRHRDAQTFRILNPHDKPTPAASRTGLAAIMRERGYAIKDLKDKQDAGRHWFSDDEPLSDEDAADLDAFEKAQRDDLLSAPSESGIAPARPSSPRPAPQSSVAKRAIGAAVNPAGAIMDHLRGRLTTKDPARGGDGTVTVTNPKTGATKRVKDSPEVQAGLKSGQLKLAPR